MKIIVSEFSSGFAPSSVPLCNALAKQSKSNDIIYVSDEENLYFDMLDEHVKRFQLYRIFRKNKKYKKGSIYWIYDRCKTAIINMLRRSEFVKNEHPDVVLVMGNNLAVFDQFFLKKMKKYTKVVITVHDVILQQKSFGWSISSLKRSYNIADGLVVHSQENKQELMHAFGIPESKIQVTHLGVEPTYRKLSKEQCRDSIGADPSKPVLLFYGSIRESKGLDILLKALKNVDCQLVIAGAMLYGETFDKYEQLLQENEVHSIKYIEFTSEEFRDVLFQAADFIVLPYKEFHSQSGPFMQAIQYQKPIIATDVSSFRGYVEKYNLGYICQPQSIEDLHKVIKRALAELAEGKWNDMPGARRAIYDNSWETSAAIYLKYFEEILMQ